MPGRRPRTQASAGRRRPKSFAIVCLVADGSDPCCPAGRPLAGRHLRAVRIAFGATKTVRGAVVPSFEKPADLVASVLNWDGAEDSVAPIFDMIEDAFGAADPLDHGHGLSDIVAHRRELDRHGELSWRVARSLWMDIESVVTYHNYPSVIARSLKQAAVSSEKGFRATMAGEAENAVRLADRARRLLEAAAADGREAASGISSEEQRSLDLFEWASAIHFSFAVIANGGVSESSFDRAPNRVHRVGGAVEAAAGAIQLHIVENEELTNYVAELEHWVSIVELQLRGAAAERSSAVEELRRARWRISELEALRDQLRAQLHQSDWDRERLLMAAQSTKRAARWFSEMTAGAVGGGGGLGLLSVWLTSLMWGWALRKDGCHAEEVPTGVQA